MSLVRCNNCGDIFDSDDVDCQGFVEGHPKAPSYDTGAWLCRDCWEPYMETHCPTCGASTCCYQCATQGGEGTHLLGREDGP